MIAGHPGLRDLSPCWLERLAELWPSRPAVTDPDTGITYSYGDLLSRCREISHLLAAAGVREGDRVVTIAENNVALLDLFFACGRLGAMLVPLNWRLSGRELQILMEDIGPSVVFCDPVYRDLARSVTRTGAPIFPVMTDLMDYTEFRNDEPIPPTAHVRMADPWLILYTGGTTGTPKGAILTHSAITWNAINTAMSWGLSERDCGPVFTPMFHTGGWNVFTLPLLFLGGRVILPRRFDPHQVLAIIQRERPSVFFLVPTMFQRVAEQPEFEKTEFSCLRWAISGGAPLPDSIAARWKTKVAIFKQGYGLTEVGPNNFATPDCEAGIRRGTVGKLTLFARARIVDDDGNDVPDGTPGELLLAGPHMCAGYWRQPEATDTAMRNGWFHTGDIARRDVDGFYYIIDRKKDMIITGGENVYPSEVEAILYEHLAVREAAVVGLPHPVWGEAVCAVLSLKPGQNVTSEELRDEMRENVARYKVPKTFVIIDDLPKSEAGKILRSRAREIAHEQTSQEHDDD